MKTLSAQLTDLRDQMTEQRKQKQRIGLLNSAPSLLNLGGGAGSVAPGGKHEHSVVGAAVGAN